MTTEEKALLYKDLCGRLPYGVRCKVKDMCLVLTELSIVQTGTFMTSVVSAIKDTVHIEDCKPYLRPLSDMTEEEKKFLKDKIGDPFGQIHFSHIGIHIDGRSSVGIPFGAMNVCIEFLSANHFDYRGLIERGLALKALDGMYKKPLWPANN